MREPQSERRRERKWGREKGLRESTKEERIVKREAKEVKKLRVGTADKEIIR